MSTFDTLKKNIVSIAAVLTAVTALALAPINFDSRYAHAADVKEMRENQQQQTQAIKQAITQQQLNWLEYYNDRIKALTRERDNAVRPERVEAANRDIDDIKFRKQILEKSLIESTSSAERRSR